MRFFMLSVFIFPFILWGQYSNKKDNRLPGTIEIDTNFHVDQTEIGNFHFLEFASFYYWKCGQKDSIYDVKGPQKKVWYKENRDYDYLDDYYFRSPTYRDYPMVGITKELAEEFAAWRSDRVFEYFLIQKKVIPLNLNFTENLDEVFTIERYFKGEYKGIEPDSRYMFYPVYRLPTAEEQEKMLAYNKVQFEKYAKKGTAKYPKQFNGVSFRATFNDTLIITLPIYSISSADYHLTKKSKGKILYYLTDNVAELSSDRGIGLTGSWKMKKEEQSSQNEVGKLIAPPNVFTGFRCVAEWKEYKK